MLTGVSKPDVWDHFLGKPQKQRAEQREGEHFHSKMVSDEIMLTPLCQQVYDGVVNGAHHVWLEEAVKRVSKRRTEPTGT